MKPPCRQLCLGASDYHPGLMGQRAEKTGLMFILNHSDSRAKEQTLFDDYMIALLKSRTGRRLNDILKISSLDFEDVFITNLFKCLLPEDREPLVKEYRRCLSILEAQIEEFRPKKLVLFGHLVYKSLFSDSAIKTRIQTW